MNKEGNNGKKNRLMQYGVLVIALMMIVSSGVYATIFITDEGSYDSDYDDQYVTGEESTYIMWRNADTYYCRSGSNGKIVESSSDAQALIQKYAMINGSRIFLKNSIYDTDDTINITNAYNVTIEGESHDAVIKASGDFCIIRLGSRTFTSGYNSSVPCVNFHLKGFKIDGTLQTSRTSVPEDVYAPTGIEIAGRDTINTVIENVYLYNIGNDGIYGFSAGNCLIKNCYLYGIRGYWAAVHPHQETSKLPWTVESNTFVNCSPSGIRHSLNIIGNTIIDTTTGPSGQVSCAIVGSGTSDVEDLGSQIIGNYLINTDVTTYSTRGIRSWGGFDNIIGNHIFGFKLEAINTGGMSDINIVGNYIRGNKEYAIHVYQSSNISICNNYILDHIGTGKGSIELRNFSAGSFSNISIVGNYVNNRNSTKPPYCLVIQDTYSDVYVADNYFSGYTGTKSIYDLGTNTIKINNIGYNFNTLNPYYEQDAEPTLDDNTTAYWYETDTGYLYQIINTYGDTWYTNFTKTI